MSIPASLSQAKADPRLPAAARIVLWCAERETDEAPSAGVAARVLKMPRRTAAHAIAALVTCGALKRAA